jgi:hypothetical protein
MEHNMTCTALYRIILLPTETKYSTMEREILGVPNSLEHYRHTISYSKTPLIIVRVHRNIIKWKEYKLKRY